MYRKWLVSVLRDETKSAFILFFVSTATILWVLSPFADSLFKFAETPISIAFIDSDLRTIASEYLLAIFFLIAGIELRHELTSGSLDSFKKAATPAFAAIGGMVFPALIFIATSDQDAAWGVPMATDLPFALGVIAIFGKRLSLEVRAFLLALAIVDDALSVLVITFAFGHASIHPTFIAVIIGLAIPSKNGLGEKIREKLQPVSSGVALPLFAITALAVPVTFADFFSGQTFAVASARLIGKPVGVLVGALIAIYVFKAISSISRKEILIVGCVASIGFSVSLLFANLSGLSQVQLIAITAAIIAAIPLCAGLGAFAASMPKGPSK
jgi:NhaA family Na+:H+ antiporter